LERDEQILPDCNIPPSTYSNKLLVLLTKNCCNLYFICKRASIWHPQNTRYSSGHILWATWEFDFGWVVPHSKRN